MINFHKYGFLDVKHLKRIIDDYNFWLCELDPIYLFIWSDLYKPEICFNNDFCFIRLLIPEVGICYYPPIGNGNLKMALFDIKEDAWENGIDFKIVGIDDKLKRNFNFVTTPNPLYSNYIYLSDSLALFNNKGLKPFFLKYNKFMKGNKNVFFKLSKKEDFTRILEFISIWQNEDINRSKDPYFYPSLNMLKKVMEHLYELELKCLIIQNENGEIYSISIFHSNNNVGYVHFFLCLNKPGLLEVTISQTAKVISKSSRYINLECHLGNLDKEKLYNDLKPLKFEEYYTNLGGNISEEKEE